MKGFIDVFFADIVKQHDKDIKTLAEYKKMLMELKDRFPNILDSLIKTYPFRWRLRKFKKKSAVLLDKVFTDIYNINNNNEKYDATLTFCFYDKWKNIKILIELPIIIDIDKLLSKIKSKKACSFKTDNLVDLISNEIKENYVPTIETKDNRIAILLCDKRVFKKQIIDGNHRILHNNRDKKEYSEVLLCNADDLKGCYNTNLFDEIVDMFIEFNEILNIGLAVSKF